MADKAKDAVHIVNLKLIEPVVKTKSINLTRGAREFMIFIEPDAIHGNLIVLYSQNKEQ